MKGGTAAPKSTTGSLVTRSTMDATSGESKKPAVAVCDHHERGDGDTNYPVPQPHKIRGRTPNWCTPPSDFASDGLQPSSTTVSCRYGHQHNRFDRRHRAGGACPRRHARGSGLIGRVPNGAPSGLAHRSVWSLWMRLPCTPLISKGWTVYRPRRTTTTRTPVLGCGATAIWNSNRRRRGDLDFELGAHISLIAPIIRGSATKTTRCGTPATIGQRLTLSGCPAFGIPSRLSLQYVRTLLR